MSLSDRYAEHLRQRARRIRERAWRLRDGSDPYAQTWKHIETSPLLEPVREIRQRAMQRFVQEGGDLEAQHRKASLAMSTRAMPIMKGYVVLNKDLYPEHSGTLSNRWSRAVWWLGLTHDKYKRRLPQMRLAAPGSPEDVTARNYDEAFMRYMGAPGSGPDVVESARGASFKLGLDLAEPHDEAYEYDHRGRVVEV